jgi:hypothetical protein
LGRAYRLARVYLARADVARADPEKGEAPPGSAGYRYVPELAEMLNRSEFVTDAADKAIERAKANLRHRDKGFEALRYRLQENVPRLCELLFCLLVDPEFQADRLADYQERFTDLWVPKFGHRMAVLLYLWHVLRQSRFIEWIIRLLSNGSP